MPSKDKDSDARTEGLLKDTTTGASKMQTVNEGATTTDDGTTTTTTASTYKPAPASKEDSDKIWTPLVIRSGYPAPKETMEVSHRVVTFKECDGSGSPLYFDLEITNDSWDVQVFRMKCSYGMQWFRANPNIAIVNKNTTKRVRLWYANRPRHPAKTEMSPAPFFTIVYGPTCNLVDDFDEEEDDIYNQPHLKLDDEGKTPEQIKEDNSDPELLRNHEKWMRLEALNQWRQFGGIHYSIRIDIEFVDKEPVNWNPYKMKRVRKRREQKIFFDDDYVDVPTDVDIEGYNE